MNYDANNINTWPAFKPLIIAHDIGRSRDRSTAVVGGNSPYGRRLLGIAVERVEATDIAPERVAPVDEIVTALPPLPAD